MDDAIFMSQLEEARKRIDLLPPDQKEPLRQLLEETHKRHSELKDNFSHVHNALADWKVNIKYLLFDLEATKRELAELKRKQQENGDGHTPNG